MDTVESRPTLRERRAQRTREAIEAAALRLFGERGFEAVTLAEVAEAAEVGQRTLFRYAADKEDLLFIDGGGEHHVLRAALAARPASESPAVAARESLVTLLTLWQDKQAEGRARQRVIDASPALRARERSKQAALETVIEEGLRDRGSGADSARLVARVAVACCAEGIRRWLYGDPAGPGLVQHGRRAFEELSEELNESGRTGSADARDT